MYSHYMDSIYKFIHKDNIVPDMSGTYLNSKDDFKIILNIDNVTLCLKKNDIYLTINGCKFVQTNPYIAIRIFFNLLKGGK